MRTEQKTISKWILIVSGLFAIMELLVGVSLFYSPQSSLDTVDLQAKGVDYIVRMWSVRQFALGVIFGFAVLKRSAPMLILSYLFFLVMFLGDLLIGVLQKESSLIITAGIMCMISTAMIVLINRKK